MGRQAGGTEALHCVWLKITVSFAQRTRIPLASEMMVSFLIHQQPWSITALAE